MNGIVTDSPFKTAGLFNNQLPNMGSRRITQSRPDVAIDGKNTVSSLPGAGVMNSRKGGEDSYVRVQLNSAVLQARRNTLGMFLDTSA